MHFFKTLVVGALAAIAVAQDRLQFTSAPTSAIAGQSYTLKWKGGDSTEPVTILLREGVSTDLHTVATITSSATGGEYKWDIPANLPSSGSYALQISQGSQVNFWAVGGIQGGGPSASSSASSASASSSSSSASASSSSASASSSSSSASASSASAASSSSSSTSRTGSQTSSSASRTTSASSRTSSSSSPSTTSESSSSSSSSAAAASSSAPTDGSGAAGLKSNAALVMGAVAAMAYLG